MNFGNIRPTISPARLAALKAAIVHGWSLGDGTTVMIAELACSEPNCPPVETIIALLRAESPPEKYAIHKPLHEISDEDISALLRSTRAVTTGPYETGPEHDVD